LSQKLLLPVGAGTLCWKVDKLEIKHRSVKRKGDEMKSDDIDSIPRAFRFEKKIEKGSRMCPLEEEKKTLKRKVRQKRLWARGKFRCVIDGVHSRKWVRTVRHMERIRRNVSGKC